MNQEIFGRQENAPRTFKDKLKLTLSGLSGAYMLPIATLVSLAIFLSLGGFIESFFTGDKFHPAKRIGTFLKSLAYPILQIVPLLFCVAFTISFCKGDHTCIWNSVLAYLVFLSVQGVFIKPSTVPTVGYTIFFEGPARSPTLMKNLIDKTLGLTSMNTSIFGSFAIGGLLMPYIHRNWFNVQLKGPFAFFSGKRFIPLVSIFFSSSLSIVFLIFWPWVGYGFYKFGHYLNQTPYGADSFVFGFLEKSLIPTGLHHMFYSPLWFTSLGGDAISRINEVVKGCSGSELTLTATSSTCNIQSMHSTSSIDRPDTANAVIAGLLSGNPQMSHGMWQGDSFLGLSLIGMPENSVTIDSANTMPVFDFFKDKLGLNIGKYTQGKYPIMQFCLPAAAVGMSMATDRPKEALKTFVPGILSSALLGITEPLEFTFLFAAPKLFYGFHAFMCGVSFMLMNYLGAHIPSILSGGFVEFLLLGGLPYLKGTKCWIAPMVGLMLAPFYVGVFFYAVKKRILTVDLPEAPAVEEPARPPVFFTKPTQAPVREGGEPQKAEEAPQPAPAPTAVSKVPDQTRKLALALGGWSNIAKMANCASRLRYDIVDKSKVDEAGLKAAGIIAVKWVGDNHLQAIVGPKAESINQEMLKWNGEEL